MPMQRARYPSNWKTEIVPRILHRARNRCERCGLRNYSVVSRLGARDVFYGDYHTHREARITADRLNTRWGPEEHYIVIHLAIAHLHHNIADSRDEVLAALCQRCHLRHDTVHHRNNAKQTRARLRQERLWDDKNFVV